MSKYTKDRIRNVDLRKGLGVADTLKQNERKWFVFVWSCAKRI